MIELIRKLNSKSGKEFFLMKFSFCDIIGIVDVFVIGNEEKVRCILIK